MSQPSSKA